MQIDERLKANINIVVKQALDEDIGEQDITSSLIEKSSTTKASILTRQKMIFSGFLTVYSVKRYVGFI